MSFRTSLLARVDAARAKSQALDVRTHQLTVRTRVWSGDLAGDGIVVSTNDLVLPPRYPVRYASDADVQGSGGRYELTDLKVEHITPYDGVSVGYTPEQLVPPVTDLRVDIVYILTGPQGGTFSLSGATFLRSFTYTLFLRRKL